MGYTIPPVWKESFKSIVQPELRTEIEHKLAFQRFDTDFSCKCSIEPKSKKKYIDLNEILPVFHEIVEYVLKSVENEVLLELAYQDDACGSMVIVALCSTKIVTMSLSMFSKDRFQAIGICCTWGQYFQREKLSGVAQCDVPFLIKSLTITKCNLHDPDFPYKVGSTFVSDKEMNALFDQAMSMNLSAKPPPRSSYQQCLCCGKPFQC